MTLTRQILVARAYGPQPGMVRVAHVRRLSSDIGMHLPLSIRDGLNNATNRLRFQKGVRVSIEGMHVGFVESNPV